MNFGVDSQLESLTISYAAWIFERRNSFIVLTDGLTTLIVTADRYFRTYINSCKSIFLIGLTPSLRHPHRYWSS
jgi:hypothetical protein